ncbi:hypothetical protein [Halovivax cerinus]|uniref:Uncharacterized protein n=1 Tax=Halovivax cerinus TaxID=1487865 RepID=A0ABD5NR36_9EURY|nr:hypothetical protein [Halovivax cerinus]
MDDTLSRRRLVQVGASGTALTLAGCQFQGADDSVTADGETTVAVSPPIDQQELLAARQQAQQTVQPEVESGNMTEEEAQNAVVAAQEEVVTGYLDDLQTSLEAETDLSVTDTSTQTGLALVDGDAASLIGALDLETVAAILPESSFSSA